MGNRLSILFFIMTISCHANAIVPLINIFMPSTIVPASILTIFIILIEAYLLKRWERNILFKSHLKYSIANNLASSFIGSVIVFFTFSQPFWEILLMYPLMFIVTVIVETPMLKHEYKSKLATWKDAIKKSLSIHLHSYFYVFLFQPVMYILFAFYLNLIHEQSIKNWNNRSIIQNEKGSIYYIKKVYENNNSLGEKALYKYDIKYQNEEKINLKLNMDDRIDYWDVKGHTMVYAGINNTINTINLNNGQLLQKIKFKKNTIGISISPNKDMVAILEYVKNLKGERDTDSYYMLGSTGKLKIYSLKSGELIHTVSRLAFGYKLSWSSDSKKVFFVSLRNEIGFNDSNLSHLKRGYGRAYLKDDQYARSLYSYDLNLGRTATLINGDGIVGVTSKNILFFIKENKLYSMDLENNKVSILENDMQSSYGYSISPSGNNIVMLIHHKRMMSYSSFLTIVSLDKPNNKLIIDEDYSGAVIWTK